VPENAEPVGILPTPGRTRCGKKGKDTGKEGEAEMAEWPWHVRIFLIAACLNVDLFSSFTHFFSVYVNSLFFCYGPQYS